MFTSSMWSWVGNAHAEDRKVDHRNVVAGACHGPTNSAGRSGKEKPDWTAGRATSRHLREAHTDQTVRRALVSEDTLRRRVLRYPL